MALLVFHRDATLAHSAALAAVPHRWTSCGPLRPWRCHVANDSWVVSDGNYGWMCGEFLGHFWWTSREWKMSGLRVLLVMTIIKNPKPLKEEATKHPQLLLLFEKKKHPYLTKLQVSPYPRSPADPKKRIVFRILPFNGPSLVGLRTSWAYYGSLRSIVSQPSLKISKCHLNWPLQGEPHWPPSNEKLVQRNVWSRIDMMFST